MITLRKQHRRYEKYSESGVEWLGEIPEEWKLVKFKGKFSVSNERVEDDPSVHQILSISGYRGVELKDISSNEGQMPSEDISQYRIVRPGQLAVNTMWLNYSGLGISKFTGYVSPVYRAYNIDKSMEPSFVHNLMRSVTYVQKYSSLLYGIRPNSLQVKQMDFERIEILVPTQQTQKRIGDYLDEKCALIDSIIAKKQRQLELLKEKRAAIINRAVTRGLPAEARAKAGLDEGVEMKESGVEWIGKVPKGWEVINMKYLAFFQNGFSFSSDTYVDEGLPIVRISDIGKPHIDPNEFRRVPNDTRSAIQNFRIKRGDILLALTGATIGKSTLCDSDEEMYLNQRVAILRPSKRISIKFLDLTIRSDYVQEKIKVICFGGAQDNIGKPDIGRIPLFVPSVDQQDLIVDEAERLLGSQGKMLIKIEESLSLLTEYKTSLIAHAVTGRIKVPTIDHA
jgi:type I restriction enzyme, S subunit